MQYDLCAVRDDSDVPFDARRAVSGGELPTRVRTDPHQCLPGDRINLTLDGDVVKIFPITVKGQFYIEYWLDEYGRFDGRAELKRIER